MSALVAYLEGFDPLLMLFDEYSVCVYCILFLSLFIKTKNYLALVIAGESIAGYLANNYLTDIHILAITGQFIIYGFALYLTRRNPLILLSYLILMAHFLIQYIANSIHLTHNTWATYNVAVLVYYSFFALLPLILILMVKGLFSKWGKGHERGGFRNSFYNFNDNDNFMFGCNIYRFKRLFKKST